jgi:peptidoglycan/LPS O-acetylase OafA/YrhL
VEDLFVARYLPWFVAGVGFHALRQRSRLGWLLLAQALLALSVPGIVHARLARPELIVFAAGCAFFFALLYRPAWVAPFATPVLALIGEASYSLYLLHQEIGVALLQMLDHFAVVVEHPWVGAGLAVLLAVGIAALACSIYRYWERPAKSWLLRMGRTRGAGADLRSVPAEPGS